MTRSIPLLFALTCAFACTTPPVDVGEGEGEGAHAGGEGEGDVGEGEGDVGEGEGDVGEGEGAVGEGEGAIGEGEGEGAAGSKGPYDVDGPEGVTTVDIDVTTDAGHHFTEHVFLPSSTGTHPVVSLSPGLEQPAVAYTSYGDRLASHRFVVVMRDDPGVLTQTSTEVDDIVFVVSTWLPEQNTDPQSPLFGLVDTTRIGLAGHSRGGKASAIAAENGAKGLVRGWFGLDPVDASTISGDVFAATDLANIDIPIAMIGGGVSSSCSPTDSNSDVLFAAAASPAVQLVGVGAGHTQFEDADSCFVCAACSPSGTADGDVVLAYSVRYLTAFFARELLGDASVGATFQGAGVDDDVTAGLIELNAK